MGLVFLSCVEGGKKFSRFMYLFYFFVLFISFPCCLAVFYKYVVGMGLLITNVWIFSSWCFYTVSEQLFLFAFLLNRFNWRSGEDLFSLV